MVPNPQLEERVLDPTDDISGEQVTEPPQQPNAECKDIIKETTTQEASKKEAIERDSDIDEQHKAWDDCIQRCQKHKERWDDSSDSCNQSDIHYEGGMAGLDPDHSSEWVPSSINVSKSKKRRRRQKNLQEQKKKRDSLGKLLRGEQSKEDEELISTYDSGNKNSEKKKKKGDKDQEVLSGNLHKPKRGIVHDWSEQDSFAATLNSTRYGPDFDNDDDPEILREGSGQEEDAKAEDSPANCDEQDDFIPDDIVEDHSKEEAHDDSLSSNSTGAKRKRKRNKKSAPKQPKIDQFTTTTGGTEVGGVATRSKTQPRGNEVPEPKDDTKTGTQNKGEKEKPPRVGPNVPKLGQQDGPFPLALKAGRELAAAKPGPSQVSETHTFKQPKTMSRQDLQRLVSKAVQKSKTRQSNNFAFNSKIQRFKVITDSANVPKFPDIDMNKPIREVAIPEFIWSDQAKTVDGMVDVKTRGVIQFVVLARPGHVANEAWDTPRLELVRDFASFLLCTIAELKLEFGTILRWTNPWGNVVVVGLDSSDLELLQKFRTFFTTLKFNHHYFNTFPKDAMVNSLSLYILLKSELREFKEEYLAEALFARNKLYGVLETIEAETYTAADTTRAGVSKNGWRNVLLQGDEVFLRSLSTFTALHWFNIGPASVQIHGGERRAETEEEIEAKNKRKRLNMPAGQNLTSAARASINHSVLVDQQALLLKKRTGKSTAQAPAPESRQANDVVKASQSKKKK